MSRIRPQIFLAIIILGGVAALGILKSGPEVSTACISGCVALAMQILQNE